MKKSRIISAVCVCLFACMPANGASVTFSDGTFDPSDWTTTEFTFGDGGFSTISQQATGGNPDFFRQIQLTINPTVAPNENSVIFAYNEYQGGSYLPSTQGAISSIDFSEDTRFVTGTAGGLGASIWATLRQNGTVYTSFVGQGAESSWTTKSALSLIANDFSELSATGSAPALITTSHPDFSSAGDLIRFGFIHANSTGGFPTTLSNTVGADNWSMEITSASVPIPPTLWLFGSGLLGLIGIAKKRKAT